MRVKIALSFYGNNVVIFYGKLDLYKMQGLVFSYGLKYKMINCLL